MPLPPIMSYEDLVEFLTEELESRRKKEEKTLESVKHIPITRPNNVIDFTAYLKKIKS